jgi:hypothetical protein
MFKPLIYVVCTIEAPFSSLSSIFLTILKRQVKRGIAGLESSVSLGKTPQIEVNHAIEHRRGLLLAFLEIISMGITLPRIKMIFVCKKRLRL